MNLFNLTGRSAVVTGGGRGLGRALASGLAQAGAVVAVAGRNRPELEAAASEIRDAGGRAVALRADLLDPAGCDGVIEAAVGEPGQVDLVVHAAGSKVRKPAVEMDGQDLDGILDVHLKAAFLLARRTAQHLTERGAPGKIIFVGSLNSHVGIRNLAPYAAAKSGLIDLARVLANEWATAGICVNTIVPGYFRTALTEDLFADPVKHQWINSRIPMGRLGQPDDLAGAAVFLASNASDYVTGAEIRVDGGWLAT